MNSEEILKEYIRQRDELRKENQSKIEEKLKNKSINDCNIALLGIVKDKKDGTIFYDYEKREDIGKNIYYEIMSKYFIEDEENFGFKLSDELPESGVQTNAQGASIFESLITKFKVGDEAINLYDNYKKVIKKVMEAVGGTGEYRFDANPYNVKAFDEEYLFVDTITWVISALLGAYRINNDESIPVKFNDFEVREMSNIIAYGIDYLNKCFCDGEDVSKNIFSKGWNFTKDCKEPSLYFTFAVSECYIDIYDTFKLIVDKHNIENKIREIKNDQRYHNGDEFDLNSDKDKEETYLSQEDQNSWKNIKSIDKDEMKRIERLFDVINADGNYYKLEQNVKDAANDIWRLVKDGLDSNFYNVNLSGTIDNALIESSSSNNALFNNVFIINTIINGGLDEDISDKLARSIDDDEMNKIQGEYDNLLEILQAAFQKTVRYNKFLASKKKDYIVNDFIISCNETFEGEMLKKSQELRKRRIKVFSISPMLIKTNNVISEFLTKYPQADMIKYLDELIMRKRTFFEKDDKTKEYNWIWENGDYLITANHYYITSLASFYEYLDEYENRFTRIDQENNDLKQSIKDDYKEELEKSGEIHDLRVEKASLEEKVANLENDRSKIVDEIKALIKESGSEYLNEWFRNNINEMYDKIFNDMFSNDDHEAYLKNNQKDIEFLESVRKLVFLMIHDIIEKRFVFSFGENLKTEDFMKRLSEFEESSENKVSQYVKDFCNRRGLGENDE